MIGAPAPTRSASSRDGEDDDADDAGGAGRWYAMWITDKSTGADTKLASIKFPYSGDDAPKLRLRDNGFGSLIAITGESAITATNIPVAGGGHSIARRLWGRRR